MCDDFNLQKFNQFLASRKNKDVDMDKEKCKEQEENVSSKSGVHKIPKLIIRKRSQSGPRVAQVEKKVIVTGSGDHDDDDEEKQKTDDNDSIEESNQDSYDEEGNNDDNEESVMSTVEEGDGQEEVRSTDTTRWQEEEQRFAEKSLTEYEQILAAIQKGKEEAADKIKSKPHELRKSKEKVSNEEEWFEEDDDQEEEMIECATSKRKGPRIKQVARSAKFAGVKGKSNQTCTSGRTVKPPSRYGNFVDPRDFTEGGKYIGPKKSQGGKMLAILSL